MRFDMFCSKYDPNKKQGNGVQQGSGVQNNKYVFRIDPLPWILNFLSVDLAADLPRASVTANLRTKILDFGGFESGIIFV